MQKLCALAVLLAALLVNNRVMAEQLTVGENLRHEQITLPASIPDRNHMVVLDYTMFLDDGGAAGILVFYDDLRTKWGVDYIEFYDVEGTCYWCRGSIDSARVRSPWIAACSMPMNPKSTEHW